MMLRRLENTLQSAFRAAAYTWGRPPWFASTVPLHYSRAYGSIWHRNYVTEGSTERGASEEMVPERLYSKINVNVKGADYMVLDSYCRFVITAAKALQIDIGGRVALPNRIQKFTVLKSPHIYKKHRVQYEIRTYSRLMQVKKITGTTADVFLEYIQRNLPEGVTMSVYQEELEALPALLTAPEEGGDGGKTAGGKTKTTRKRKDGQKL